MGISGLIPFLEKASTKLTINQLKGKTVAIDTYCWLHKGAFAVAEKLVRGEETDVHIQYCLKYVNMLLQFDIKPILVFDGQHLPAKAATESKRRENKKEAKKLGLEMLRKGNKEQARSYLRRCVDITHKMALELIKECRKMNVDCIVAPYEADAQLAYLNKIKIADYIITEDSDLVLFGCSKIIFKLDLTGTCLLIESDKLHLAMGCKIEKFSFEKFQHMCILSGCDYLDSLPGIGLAKSCKFILKTEDDNIRRALLKIPSYLNMRNLTVTDEYIEEFMKALATFQHMYVYDPIIRKTVRLTDISETGIDEKYCSNAGHPLNDEIAFQLALGNIDPFDLKTLDYYDPDKPISLGEFKSKSFKQVKISKHPSIWKSKYRDIIQKKEEKPKEKIKKSPIKIAKVIKIKRLSINETREVVYENDNQGCDLLMKYCKEKTPEYIESKEYNEQSSPINEPSPKKLKRNPFFKSNTIDFYEMEHDTDKDNGISLLQKISPVKRCEYKKNEISSSTQIINKKPIVSPFFKLKKSETVTLSQTTVLSDCENIPTVNLSDDDDDDENNKQSNMGKDLLKIFEYKQETLKTIDENINESDLPKNAPNTPSKSNKNSTNSNEFHKKVTPVKVKQSARRIGLTKKTSMKSTIDINSTQLKLSEFGFKKKTISK